MVLPRSSRSVRHLFASAAAVPLPRWLEAFPEATLHDLSGPAKPPPRTALVWLRLEPDLPALEQLAALRESIGAARVIALTSRPDNEEALALFSAGVRGYCNAHATAANLRQVADVVQAGGLWIGEALMQRLLASTRAAISRTPQVVAAIDTSGAKSAKRFATLTRREQEVAGKVAGGSSNKEIARELAITERTVKAHVGAIFQKLNARDRLHLALIVNGQQPA